MIGRVLRRSADWLAVQPDFALGVLITGSVSVVLTSIPHLIVLGLLGGLVSVLLAIAGVVINAFRTGDVRGQYRLLALGVFVLLMCGLVSVDTIWENPEVLRSPQSSQVCATMQSSEDR